MSRTVAKRACAAALGTAAALWVSGCFNACNLVKNSSLQATPNPVSAGEQATFETRFTVAADGARPTKVDFDLDGDGVLETAVDPERLPPTNQRWRATVRRSYESPATVEIHSAVHASQTGGFSAASVFAGRLIPLDLNEYHLVQPVTLQVQRGPNQPPLASFTTTPNPVAPEGQVTYDASDSMDPDGDGIVRYEWDLDGNGTYELDTGTSPTTTQMESTMGFGPDYPRQYTAGLRVTDGAGETGTTTRAVTVEHPPRRLARSAKSTRRLTLPEARALAPRMRQVDAGQLQVNGDQLLVQDRIDRGRLPADPFPDRLRRGERKVRWLSNTDLVIDSTAGGSGNARGFALLRFPAGGRACMGFRVDSPLNGKPEGALRILGGAGRAKGLRGRGTGEAKMTRDGLVIDGRFDVGFGGRRQFQLGKSGCAPLLGL
jgi:hypothetical protein